MMRRILLPLTAAGLIWLGAAAGHAATPTIAVISDPHYYDTNLGTTGLAIEKYLAQDRKMLRESAAILEAAIEKIQERGADIVFICGDLTKDGEKTSHEKFAERMKDLEASGKKVFLVPGNHDLNNPHAVRYDGDQTTPVANVSPEDFVRIYGAFGYDEAIERDPHSLSYLAEPAKDFWLIGIDTCRYDNNQDDPETGGGVRPETLDWILKVLEKAERRGVTVAAMSHHGILEHYSGQKALFGDYVIDDWEATAQTLAGAGLKWIFTGHYHANDIVEKAFDGDAAITDVETGSLVTFPCPVRFVTLHGGNAAVIETETVDAIDDDTGGVPFPQYAEAFLMEGLTGIAAYTLAQPVDQGGFGLTDPSQIAQIAGLIAQAFKAHYAGDETPDTGTLQTIQALTGSPDPTQQQLGGYLATLWTDPAPRDDRHYLPLAPTVELALLGTYRDPKAEFDDGASEIVAHDPATQRLFVINGSTNELDILDAVDPENLALIRSVPLEPYGAGGPTSVAASKGLVAVAVAAEPSQDPGTVVLMDVDGVILDAVPTGALPDMVTFTPDGSTLLVANEGEPSDDYTVDPEGSVTVVSLQRGRGTGLKARTASFRQFNRLKSWLKKQGVRIFGPGASVAQDLEPESIATSRDGRWAWVSCQENNAVALLHVPSAHFTAVYPLGFKDLGKPGNAMDASNQDGGIRIRAWPGVMGMYQPDAIAVFQDKGIPYIVTANEGDARDYDAFSEEERVKDLILDPTVFGDADLQEDENLGRLYVTTTLGDADGDGLYEALFAYGARSFSIFAQTPKGLQRIYDSGDQFERITAAALPQAFNSDNDDNDSFDSRSDDKGPEPEGLAVGVVEGRRYAFVCLERIGGIMVYDITRPWKPVFVQYLNNRNFEEDAEDLEAGDLGPEGLAFVAAQDSPTGFALLLAANEVSGSTSIYEIRPRGNHRDRFRHHWVKAR